MDVCGEGLQSRMDRFEETMRASGVKLTHQRIEVYREVARTGDHPDAETVYRRVRKRVPTISLDTVYRTLWLLDGLGLVKTIGMQRGSVRFDANAGPHHHFVCTRCAKVADFYSRACDELEVPETVKAIGDVASVHVQFRGLCSRCRGKNEK